MPRGMEGVRKASAEVEAKRGQGGPSALWFRLASGEESPVRFLEQDDDIAWAWMHEIPVEGRQWGRNVPCCDQERDGTPCPGCEREMDRRFKGYINLIWPEAPVFKKDKDGKIVRDSTNDPVVLDHKPQVAILSSGIRLFEELEEVNTNYRGLMSRRFKIKRKGSGLDTKYVISPVDIDSGPQELDAEEKKLAEEKYDLSQFTTPLSYEDFEKELRGERTNTTTQTSGEAGEQKSANPFMRRRSS